jgi:hypothetical protein
MTAGGARKGGGRRAGIPNKASIRRQEIVYKGGLAPLDYLLQVMRDTELTRAERVEAAKAAAPYVHPRLSSVQAHVTGELDIRKFLTDAE